MLNREHNNDTVPSVLEVLLKVDKVVAIIMAVDILLAGVDTVSISSLNYFLQKKSIRNYLGFDGECGRF